MNPKVFWEGAIVGPWSQDEASGLTIIRLAKPWLLRWPGFVTRIVVAESTGAAVLVVSVGEMRDFAAQPVTSILLDNFHPVLGRSPGWANVRMPLVCGLVQEPLSTYHGLLIRGSSRPVATISRVDVLRIVIGVP